MPVLQYGGGSQIIEHRASGLLAIATSAVTEIGLVKMPNCAVFLVEDHVQTVDRWCGDRPQFNEWRAGSVAFLPAGSELNSRPDRRYRETIVSLDDKVMAERALAYLTHSGVTLRYADVTSDATTAIARTLHGLIVSGEGENWPLLTDSLALAMSVAVAKGLARAEGRVLNLERGALDATRQRRVMQYIEENVANKMRLDDMAAAAALSPFHFSRAFKKSYGVSPARYVLGRRIQEAQHLLRNTTQSLAEIALACGCASQSHFTTAFKTEVGVTPSEYRRVAKM